MKDVIIRKREWLVVSPGERYSVPDNIAEQLLRKGSAETVAPEAIEQMPDRVEPPKRQKKTKKIEE